MKIPRFPLLLIMLLLCAVLNAQWTTQTNVNTLVSTASAEDFKSIGTIEGKTWVAFWKLMPAPVNYQLWVQLLDANGDTLFGPEGLPLNTVVPMSTYTTIWDIATDGSENLYVAINGTGSGNPVYAHKITTSGTKPWGANGLLVGSGYDPKILLLTNGEVIVSWLPGNQAQFQKIDTSGALAWTSPKTVPPGVPGHSCTAGELKALSGGGFLVFIHDRSGFGISSQFYAMRYDNAGLPLWTVPKALATSYTSYNARYDVVMDYDTAYLGYYASIGLVFYSYLQRLNPDGTTPWGINGSDFATQTSYYEMNTSIAYEPGSPYIWAICRFTPSSQGQSGEYVQKFDKKTGARLLGANAKQVFAISSNDNAHAGHLQLVNDQPLFLITDGTNNGALPIDLLVTYLDSLGNFAWPGQTMDMGTYSSFKSRIDFLRPYQDQAVAVWGENRGSGSRIYAQNIVPCIVPQAGFGYTALNLDVWFTSFASGADTVVWDFGDGSSGGGNNPMHTYADTGTYNVCQYVTNACGSDTLCQPVHITCPLPVAGFGWTANSLAVTFTGMASGADSLYWDFGDGAYSSLTNPLHTYALQGLYDVCLYAFNDCGIDTFCLQINVIQTGMEEMNKGSALVLYPNPGRDEVFVALPSASGVPAQIRVFDASGQWVREYSGTEIRNGGVLRLSGLRPGCYFLDFRTGESVVREKFIILP